MFVQWMFSILVGGILFCAGVARAQSTNDDSAPGYDSFGIISTRNIFDPNRRGIRPWIPPSRTRTPDSFALVGTMSYSKGKFAFFDSPKAEYKKVLEPGATIAGYTVKDITPKSVILTANTNEVAMNVGNEMLNEGPGRWKLSTDRYTPSTSDQNTQPGADVTPPAGASPAMSDVLKRLAEQRQQMLTK